MRLLDQVVQSGRTVSIVDGRGRHAMPGAGQRASALLACPLRYVLGPDVAETSRQVCRMLVGQISTSAVRMPAPSFWAEWAELDGRRTGALVTADLAGRSGTIETFWEQANGDPDLAQVLLHFDLDHDLAVAPDAVGWVAIGPAEHPLHKHLLFEVDAHWAGHFYHMGPVAGYAAVRRAATEVAPVCGMVLGFALLLTARSEIVIAEVDRSRLNRARKRLNRTVLLDHKEVRLNLDAQVRPGDLLAGTGRGQARLHLVRGHFVRRGERVFWRRSHTRGSSSPAVLSRTVLVAGTNRRRWAGTSAGQG